MRLNRHLKAEVFGSDLMTPAVVQMLRKGRALVFTSSTTPINLVRVEPGTYNEKSAIVPPPRRVFTVKARIK